MTARHTLTEALAADMDITIGCIALINVISIFIYLHIRPFAHPEYFVAGMISACVFIIVAGRGIRHGGC